MESSQPVEHESVASNQGMDPNFYKPIAMWGWGFAASLFLLTIFLFIFAQSAASSEKQKDAQIEELLEENRGLKTQLDSLKAKSDNPDDTND